MKKRHLCNSELQKIIYQMPQHKFQQNYDIYIINLAKSFLQMQFILLIMSTQLLFDSIRNGDNALVISMSQALLHKIDTILDPDNSTVLHIAANNSNIQIVQYYLKAYDQMWTKNPDKFSQTRKVKWLKQKDNDGFACIHYAVFRANFKLAVLFQEHGADIYQINHQGLNVLHIASQGDSPLLMYYYLNKGLKIGGTDSKGSTPLHWACYSGQQNSAYALISWGAEIDRQQFTYGMTPLHLAVMSGNGRIVRKLLLKGCDRNIRSYNGKLPLDIAQQNQYVNIAQMIIDKQGIQELMNIKTPFRRLKRYTFPFYLLLFLFASSYILNISFVISESIVVETQLTIVFLCLGLLVVIFFMIATLSNPGYLRPEMTFNEFQMLLKNKSSKICFDCKIVKPERSRHCEICKSCVSVYDHHCPWIANCVGANNYWAFFSVLISLSVFMVYTIAFEIVNLVLTDWEAITGLQVVRVICQLYCLLIASLFIIPLIFLIVVQTRNCFQNKTTFQRFSAQKLFANRLTDSSSRSTVGHRESATHKLTESASFSIEVSPSSGALREQIIENQCSITNCYKMWCDNSKNEMYRLTGTLLESN